jgi:hypothetical protein
MHWGDLGVVTQMILGMESLPHLDFARVLTDCAWAAKRIQDAIVCITAFNAVSVIDELACPKGVGSAEKMAHRASFATNTRPRVDREAIRTKETINTYWNIGEAAEEIAASRPHSIRERYTQIQGSEITF